MALYLTIQPNGIRLSDARTERWCREKAQEYLELEGTESMILKVANSNTIDFFRLLIKEGTLPHNEVFIVAEGIKYKILPNGRMPAWPPGYGDDHLLVLAKLARH